MCFDGCLVLKDSRDIVSARVHSGLAERLCPGRVLWISYRKQNTRDEALWSIQNTIQACDWVGSLFIDRYPGFTWPEGKGRAEQC